MCTYIYIIYKHKYKIYRHAYRLIVTKDFVKSFNNR